MSFVGQEGKHYIFMGLEFWAEEGLIFIEDRLDGDFHIVTPKEFKYRGDAIARQIARAADSDDKKRLVDGFNNMAQAFADAKMQGDPSDPEVARRKYRERRKAIMVTGMW